MKIFTFLILFSFLSKGFTQDFELRITPFIESKIVYKDSTSDEGLLRLASSAFKLRFKKNKNDKERKIDYEKVKMIVTNPDTENERTFQYLNHNYNKFKIFTELIYSDVLSIYISLTDPDELFYSDFDRQSIPEIMAQIRFQGGTGRLKKSDTLELPNGKKLAIPIRYSYYYNYSYGLASGVSPTLKYYILKDGTSELLRVEKNKRFLKNSQEKFSDCPDLISALKEKRITITDLPSFIEYYKITCLENKTVEK